MVESRRCRSVGPPHESDPRLSGAGAWERILAGFGRHSGQRLVLGGGCRPCRRASNGPHAPVGCPLDEVSSLPPGGGLWFRSGHRQRDKFARGYLRSNEALEQQVGRTDATDLGSRD